MKYRTEKRLENAFIVTLMFVLPIILGLAIFWLAKTVFISLDIEPYQISFGIASVAAIAFALFNHFDNKSSK